MGEGKSGKRVVAVLLACVALAVFAAWFGYRSLMGPKAENSGRLSEGFGGAPRVLADGVLYEAHSGEPGFVTAQNIRSGKEVWRTELGNVAAEPALVVEEHVVEVQVAGTPWMTLDRATGEPVE